MIASEEIEVVAITVVGRQSFYRLEILKEYLKLAQEENIPVFAGCDVPIHIGRNIYTRRFNWKGTEGKGIFSEKLIRETAVNAIIRLLNTDTGIEIVAIGPLTNIAEALQVAPHIAKNVKKLWIMGGHLDEIKYCDKIFPFGIDYNLCSDPEASLIVLKSPFEIVLVTANVTLSTWMNEEDLLKLKKLDHPFINAIVRDVEIWTPIQREYLEKHSTLKDISSNVAFLHDPLVIGCLLDESFCTFDLLPIEPMIILKDDKNTHIFRTIAHRQQIDNVTVPMKCATRVDAERFKRFFLERLEIHFGQKKQLSSNILL